MAGFCLDVIERRQTLLCTSRWSFKKNVGLTNFVKTDEAIMFFVLVFLKIKIERMRIVCAGESVMNQL